MTKIDVGNKLIDLKNAIDKLLNEKGPNVEWYVCVYEKLNIGDVYLEPDPEKQGK